MSELILNKYKINCELWKEKSIYNHNYYKILKLDENYGDAIDIYSENTIIKEDYDESSNTITLTIGYYNYTTKEFYPMISFCEKYSEEINFGDIIWKF